MTYFEIALTVYLAGILPACVIDGWYNARHDIRNAPPAICAGLAWPLLVLVLGILVPLGYMIVGFFDVFSGLGAWAAKRGAQLTKRGAE